MSFYVYILCRPDKRATGGGRAFYVGKGSGNRVYDHEAEARKGHACYKCRVIRKVWKQGGTIQRYIVFTTDDEQEAYDEEKRLIASYGRKNLTNGTDGGEGRTGLTSERSPKAKLSWAKVADIRRKYADTVPLLTLAAEYNVTEATIVMIVAQKTWKNGEPPIHRTPEQMSAIVRGEGNPRAKITQALVNEIRTRYATSGIPAHEIAPKYGVDSSIIQKILNNKLWTDPAYDPATRVPCKGKTKRRT